MVVKTEDTKRKAQPSQQNEQGSAQQFFFNKENDSALLGENGQTTAAASPFFVQRKSATGDKKASGNGGKSTSSKGAGLTEDYFHLSQLRNNEALVNSLSNWGADYVNLSTRTIDMLSLKLRFFSAIYDRAYSRYASVIETGAKEAANQTMWNGILVGIATGILAGIGAAWIAPSTKSAWLKLTVADGLTAAGSSALQGTASAGIGLWLSDLITQAGTNMQPTGLSPAVLNSNILQHLTSLYRSALGMTGVSANLAQISRLMTAAIGEARVQIAGGVSTMTPEQLQAEIDVMIAYTAGLVPMAEEMIQKTNALIDFSRAVESFDPLSKSTAEMEKDIWIMWMAGLEDSESDIIDLHPVESHLRHIGLLEDLGVDFGWYTEESDELNAIKAAKGRNAALQDQYNEAASRWGNMPAPPLPASEATEAPGPE